MDELNAMSLHVFEYLGTLSAVSNVEYKPSPGIQLHNIALWEQRNAPKKLPHDLVAFLCASNGLSVKWYTNVKAKHHLVGHFALNALQHMRQIDADFPDATHLALVLDSSKSMGDVCLVFKTNDHAEVWLRDLMSNWVFLARTFADYYRLMVVHMGLIGWQNLFTPVGLDPLTKQWFHLFVPGRLRQVTHEKQPVAAKVPILPFL